MGLLLDAENTSLQKNVSSCLPDAQSVIAPRRRKLNRRMEHHNYQSNRAAACNRNRILLLNHRCVGNAARDLAVVLGFLRTARPVMATRLSLA